MPEAPVCRLFFDRFTRLTLGALLLFSAGCGSSANTSITAPSTTAARCGVKISNMTPAVPATGGTGSVSVDTARDCSWSARADTSWITLSGTSGQGAGTLSYSVAANERGTQRRGSVTVSDQHVDVVQEAAPCKYEVTPSSREVGSSGGEVTIDLAATPGCTWTAAGDREWIAVAPSTGEGSAEVRLSVGANTGAARSATLTIAGRTVTVTQAAASGPAPPPAPPTPTPSPTPGPSPEPPPTCSPTVSPTTKATGAAGEEVIVSVTAPAGCAWTSTSLVDWIVVASGASGIGNASVRLAVAPNSGAARTGTVTVAGRQVTITQQAAPTPCTYSISPTSSGIERGAADLSVDVRSDSSCSWTAASRADWITVTAGASGAGNGSVRLRVSENTGPARTGTVLIAGLTYTIQQAGQSCTYSIKPRSYHAGRGPDDILVQVEAPAGCAWTATSTFSWVVVREGQTGTGNGTVRLIVEANTGAPRTATLTIAGLTFTLMQNGPQCTNVIDPTSRTLTAAGGDVTVTVTADTGCTWNSASDVSWIAVIEGASGVGSGSVRLRVDPNATGPARTGTVRIAGQIFTVQQDAPATCSYSIKPTWYDAGRGPDSFTVDVVADSGCTWTATSPVSWATIAEGASGSGHGTVRVVVEANAGEARSATLTIAGVAFKLSQAAQ